MNRRWLWSLLPFILLISCTPAVGVQEPNIEFFSDRAARGEHVAARLMGTDITPSEGLEVFVDGISADVVSFNENVVVFEVPTEERELSESAEPVRVVVTDGEAQAEGELRILGDVVPGEIIVLALPGVELEDQFNQAVERFFAEGIFQGLRFTEAYRRQNDLPEQVSEVSFTRSLEGLRALINPLDGTGIDERIEENIALLNRANSPCTGDLATFEIDGIPLAEFLEVLERVELPGDGHSTGHGGQGLGDYLEAIGVNPDSRDLTGEGATIAVLDSGLEQADAFGNRLLLDLDYDFVIDIDDATNDPAGHGTSVALLAAGDPTGVASAAQVLPVKVCDDGVNCRADRVAYGICHALVHAPDGPENMVINLSLGGPLRVTVHELLLRSAVDDVQTVVVASAGNEASLGSPEHFPAALSAPDEPDGIIAVGALVGEGSSWAPWDESTRGEFVDIAAPGISVTNGQLGTSFAAPLVSGATALLRNLSPIEIEACLRNTVQAPVAPQAAVGEGMLDVAAALARCAP